MVEGFCMKDRKKVEMVDAKEVTLKNNRKAMMGRCPICGTKVVKMMKKA